MHRPDQRAGPPASDRASGSRRAADAASTRLAEQVPEALRDLLRGLEAADAEAPGALARADPRHVYGSLRTLVLRLAFLLHAEARGLLPGDVLTGLHRRLREDAADDPGALARRHDAWSALLALFRRVHAGDAGRAQPARLGALFDPGDLEGDAPRLTIPRVSDDIVRRVLDRLLVVDGEPVSYRDLDVEQLGSIHEATLGYTLARANDHPGALLLRPGEERRRSGAHYTPRELTAPIVEETLRPVLAALGERPTPAQLLALTICDPAMGSGAFLVEACRQLGAHLVRAWERHAQTPALPPGDALLHHARRLVARRCLHGVDRDPAAVELAKLSLWLVTAARDEPFTFLDHALKHGDSLVGLTTRQIAAFRWDDRADDPPIEPTADGPMVALRGDAILHAFFRGGATARDRERARARLRPLADAARRGDPTAALRLRALSDELRAGDRPVIPFHWQLEFPDVFARDDPGFDVFVGNPPFLGGKRIRATLGGAVKDWLVGTVAGASGNADLSAYFLRRTFALLRRGGALGLIATNTIAQGDTLSTGLGWICAHGGRIFSATKRLAWPGRAAVVASVVCVRKGGDPLPARLDGAPVPRISAYLSHAGDDRPPRALADNRGISHVGCDLKGMGFTFDDAVPGATPLAEMRRILQVAPHSAERIFPYLGGEEINGHPAHAHRRFVIHFEELPLESAKRWPELLAIVERKVKPERATKSGALANWPWWQFWRPRAELARKLRALDRVLVHSQVSAHHGLVFQPPDRVFAHTLNVFLLPSFAAFAILQSRVHELWARFFGSTLEDRLRYTASDCFETFPFPPDWQRSLALERAGQRYYESRAARMLRHHEGLTATYNRFHDPDERAPDILELRDLHAALDRAVLAAYGWTDLADRAACEFRLDHDDRPRAARKPWRCRWPRDLHDEVLARLLALNRARADA